MRDASSLMHVRTSGPRVNVFEEALEPLGVSNRHWSRFTCTALRVIWLIQFGTQAMQELKNVFRELPGSWITDRAPDAKLGGFCTESRSESNGTFLGPRQKKKSKLFIACPSNPEVMARVP